MIKALTSMFRTNKVSRINRMLQSGRRVSIVIHGNLRNHTLLCIGGVGTPNEMFDSLAQAVIERYSLVSFEYLWDEESFKYSSELQNYADDINDIIRTVGINRFSCIAFCMGAKMALKFLASRTYQPELLLLINPNLTEKQQTTNSAKLAMLFKYVVHNPDSKRQTFEMLRATTNTVEHDRLQYLLSRPYHQSENTLYNFALYANTVISEDIHNSDDIVSCLKSVVIWDTDSDLSDHTNCSEQFVGHKNVNQIFGAYGGHYSLYYNQAVVQLVTTLIGQCLAKL